MSFLDGCSEHTDRSGHRQSTIAGGIPACSFVDEEKPCVLPLGQQDGVPLARIEARQVPLSTEA